MGEGIGCLCEWSSLSRVGLLYEFNTLSFLSRRVTVGSVVGAATLLLLFGVALTYVRYQRTRDIRSVIRSLTGRAGTIELNRRGEVTSANQKARELLRAGYEPRRHEGHEMEFGGPTQGHQTESGDETAGTQGKRGEKIPRGFRFVLSRFRGQFRSAALPTSGALAPIAELARAMLTESEGTPPRESAVSITPGQTSMVRCVRVKTGAVLTIEDISAVEYLERVKAWAPVAQKLAHGIKNPLNTIFGSVEQIELKVEDEKARKYMGYVKDEVTRLRKMSDAFMRFTKLNPPALEPKNVNEVIKRVMTKYECRMTNGETAKTQRTPRNTDSTQRHKDTKGNPE